MQLAKVDWSNMFACNGTSGKLDAFKSVIVIDQGVHVPVRMKGKAGGSKHLSMMGEIEAAVRKKKEAWARYRN